MLKIAAAATGAALLLSSSLSACSAFDDDSGAASADDGVTIAAAFYPLAYVAERVAGDHATVQNLTAPGGEPHDLELDPKETAEVASADLVVFEHGMQPSVDAAVEANASGKTVDVEEVVELHPAEHHEGETEEEGIEEDGHDHGDLDPHFWHDPLLVADVADAVADQLADIDPDHADDYRANADDLRADLEQLDTDFTDGLAQCERTTDVVSHDAFSYLEKYGLHFEPIAGLSPDAEPTPADLAHLQQLIKDDGVTTVFHESIASPKFAEQLAQDTGAQSAVLDPIEGLTDATSDEDYLSLMRANLSALEEANGC
jgi:zinc transport system substrate-binding protein